MSYNFKSGEKNYLKRWVEYEAWAFGAEITLTNSFFIIWNFGHIFNGHL